MQEVMVAVIPRFAGIMRLEEARSARDELRAIGEEYVDWKDPMSVELHEWCEGALLADVSDGELADREWIEAGRVQIAHLVTRILVSNMDGSPLRSPVIIVFSGVVVEESMHVEFMHQIREEPEYVSNYRGERHLFADKMIRWVAPLISECEIIGEEGLPLWAEGAEGPEVVYRFLSNLLLAERCITEKRENQKLALVEAAAASQNQMLLHYNETRLRALESDRLRFQSELRGLLGLIETTHLADKAVCQAELDRVKELARALTERVAKQDEEIAECLADNARLRDQILYAERQVQHLQNNMPKGGRRGGCTIS